MTKIGLIVSSARPNRVADGVARWVGEALPADLEVDLIDLAQVALPAFDGAAVPKSGAAPDTDHARAWAERVGGLDAAVIITPQYNGSYPGALKNAIDYLYAEWNGLPVVLIGYGWGDGAEVLAHLEPLMRRLDADVVGTIGLGFGEDLSTDGALSVRGDRQRALEDQVSALRERVLVTAG